MSSSRDQLHDYNLQLHGGGDRTKFDFGGAGTLPLPPRAMEECGCKTPCLFFTFVV